jgi:hypothetical protein
VRHLYNSRNRRSLLLELAAPEMDVEDLLQDESSSQGGADSDLNLDDILNEVDVDSVLGHNTAPAAPVPIILAPASAPATAPVQRAQAPSVAAVPVVLLPVAPAAPASSIDDELDAVLASDDGRADLPSDAAFAELTEMLAAQKEQAEVQHIIDGAGHESDGTYDSHDDDFLAELAGEQYGQYAGRGEARGSGRHGPSFIDDDAINAILNATAVTALASHGENMGRAEYVDPDDIEAIINSVEDQLPEDVVEDESGPNDYYEEPSKGHLAASPDELNLESILQAYGKDDLTEDAFQPESAPLRSKDASPHQRKHSAELYSQRLDKSFVLDDTALLHEAEQSTADALLGQHGASAGVSLVARSVAHMKVAATHELDQLRAGNKHIISPLTLRRRGLAAAGARKQALAQRHPSDADGTGSVHTVEEADQNVVLVVDDADLQLNTVKEQPNTFLTNSRSTASLTHPTLSNDAAALVPALRMSIAPASIEATLPGSLAPNGINTPFGQSLVGFLSIDGMSRLSEALRRFAQNAAGSAGSPTAIAVHPKFIAVGTSKSVVLLFDHFQELKGILCRVPLGPQGAIPQAAATDGAVTSIDVSPSQDFLVCGYYSGRVALWDTAVISKTSLLKLAEQHKTPVTFVKFTSASQPFCLSIDMSGCVNYLLFSRFLGMRWGVDCRAILDGTKAGVIVAVSVLLAPPESGTPASTASVLTSAFTTSSGGVPVNAGALATANDPRNIANAQPYGSLIALSSRDCTYLLTTVPDLGIVHRWARPADVPPYAVPSLTWGRARVAGSATKELMREQRELSKLAGGRLPDPASRANVGLRDKGASTLPNQGVLTSFAVPTLCRAWGNHIQFVQVQPTGGFAVEITNMYSDVPPASGAPLKSAASVAGGLMNPATDATGAFTGAPGKQCEFILADDLYSTDPVSAAAWFNENSLIYLTAEDALCMLDSSTLEEMDAANMSGVKLTFATMSPGGTVTETPTSLQCSAAIPAYRPRLSSSFQNSFAVCEGHLYMLCQDQLLNTRMRVWTERVNLLVSEGEWFAALALALDTFEAMKSAHEANINANEQRAMYAAKRAAALANLAASSGANLTGLATNAAGKPVTNVGAAIAAQLYDPAKFEKLRSAPAPGATGTAVGEQLERLLRDFVNATLTQATEEDAGTSPVVKRIPADTRKVALVLLGSALPQLKQSCDFWSLVASICIDYCVTINRTELLFGEVFDCFMRLGGHRLAGFLEQLEPYVLNGRLRLLPPIVMKSFVDHYNDSGHLSSVERCLLKLDLRHLDVDSAVKTCLRHHLYSALIYVINRGLMDYVLPIDLLLAASCSDMTVAGAFKKDALIVNTGDSAPFTHEGCRHAGYKLLLYMLFCLSGKSFPHGDTLATGPYGFTPLLPSYWRQYWLTAQPRPVAKPAVPAVLDNSDIPQIDAASLRTEALAFILESRPKSFPAGTPTLIAAGNLNAGAAYCSAMPGPSPRLQAFCNFDMPATLCVLGRVFTQAAAAVRSTVLQLEGAEGIRARRRCLPGEFPAIKTQSATPQDAEDASSQKALTSIITQLLESSLSMAASQSSNVARAARGAADTVGRSSINSKAALALAFTAFQCARLGPGFAPLVGFPLPSDQLANFPTDLLLHLATAVPKQSANRSVQVEDADTFIDADLPLTDDVLDVFVRTWNAADDFLVAPLQHASHQVQLPSPNNRAQQWSRESLLLELLRVIPLSRDQRATLLEGAKVNDLHRTAVLLLCLEGDLCGAVDAFVRGPNRAFNIRVFKFIHSIWKLLHSYAGDGDIVKPQKPPAEYPVEVDATGHCSEENPEFELIFAHYVKASLAGSIPPASEPVRLGPAIISSLTDMHVWPLSLVTPLPKDLANSELRLLRSHVMKTLSKLVALDQEATAVLLMELYADKGEEIIGALDRFQQLQFTFLQHYLQKAGALGEGRDTTLVAPGFGSVADRKAVPAEIHLKYIGLLCLFEPQSVYSYLTSTPNYPLEQTLALVRDTYKINDATAYLLERTGDPKGALDLMLRALDDKLLSLYQALRSAKDVDFTSPVAIPDAQLPLKLFTSLHRGSYQQVDAYYSALASTTSLCNRMSAKSNEDQTDQIEKLWFSMLDRLVLQQRDARSEADAIAAGTQSTGMLGRVSNPAARVGKPLAQASGVVLTEQTKQKYFNAANAVSQTVSDAIRTTLETMRSNVSLNVVLNKVLADHNKEKFGEFRETIMNMLETYTYEQRIYQTANEVMLSDKYAQVKKLHKGYARPVGVLRSGEHCAACGSILVKVQDGVVTSTGGQVSRMHTDNEAHDDVGRSAVVVFACGHSYHQACLSVSESTCPQCEQKDEGADRDMGSPPGKKPGARRTTSTKPMKQRSAMLSPASGFEGRTEDDRLMADKVMSEIDNLAYRGGAGTYGQAAGGEDDEEEVHLARLHRYRTTKRKARPLIDLFSELASAPSTLQVHNTGLRTAVPTNADAHVIKRSHPAIRRYVTDVYHHGSFDGTMM